MRQAIEERIRTILSILSTRQRLPEYRVLKLQKVLPALRRALEKVREGTYGYCDECDDAIPEERLRASPGATRCITCQTLAEES